MILVLVAHLVLALCAPTLVTLLRRRAFWVLALAPASGCVYALCWTTRVMNGERPLEVITWIPGLGLDLIFRMDTLSWFMLLVVGGVGTLVMLYCSAYFSASAHGLRRFAAVLTGFAGAMVGLVLADNVLILFVFWELTTVFSYLLIGHYFERKSSRRAAMQAIVVTTAGGLAMLVGLVILGVSANTFRLSGIINLRPSGTAVTVAVLCILAGAATKSALIPMHFWLPSAMAAPTPVSAYLHAAAMVKAGVYIVARFAPSFAVMPAWRAVVIVLGVGTLLLGGYRALRQYDLKLVLAFGTVSQLGLIVLLVGLGTQSAALAGLALLGAHAMFKAALFLVVGIIDVSTGTRDMRRLSGIGRAMPVTALAGALGTASMIGLPPFAGYVAKEGGLDALLHDGLGAGAPGWTGGVVLAAVAVGSALTVAYGIRFWWGAFGGAWTAGRSGVGAGVVGAADVVAAEPVRPASGATPVAVQSPAMWVSPVILGLLGLAAGLIPALGTNLLAPYADTYPFGEGGHLALWTGFTPVLAITAAVIGVGVLLFWQRARVERLQAKVAKVPEADRIYRRLMRRLDTFAVRVTAVTQRGSLRFYLGVILVVVIAGPGAVMVVETTWPRRLVAWDRPVQALAVAAVVVASLLAARSRRRLKAVMFVGVAGYGNAMLFLLHGAPDLAITQVLVETVTLVVFILVLRRLPPHFSDRQRQGASRWVRVALGVAVGVVAMGLAVVAPNARVAEPISTGFPDDAESYGGGRNVVNVTLVDIRAWDTVGEISVLLVAATGVASLIFLRRRSGKVLRVADAEGAGPARAVWQEGDDPSAALRLRGVEVVDGRPVVFAPDSARPGMKESEDRAFGAAEAVAAAGAGDAGEGGATSRCAAADAGAASASSGAAASAVAASSGAAGVAPGVRPRIAQWLVAVRTLAPQRRSVIFEVVTRVLFHAMIVFAVFLLFSGHNAPGGGFAAGLVVGIALTVRYLAGGRYELGEAAPVHPGLLLGSGLFLSAGFGLATLLTNGDALRSTIFEAHVPVLGTVHVVTSLFFDVGVFLVVVGLVLDILRSLGAEIDRQAEEPSSWDDETAEADAAEAQAQEAEEAAFEESLEEAREPAGAATPSPEPAGAADRPEERA